jgi:hypothetical protein
VDLANFENAWEVRDFLVNAVLANGKAKAKSFNNLLSQLGNAVDYWSAGDSHQTVS